MMFSEEGIAVVSIFYNIDLRLYNLALVVKEFLACKLTLVQ